MLIDLARMSPNQVYHAFIQTIIPRPVAWVLSDNGNGSFNLAPFSYFNGVSSNPPLVMLSVGRKEDGSNKDTRVNIEKRGDFVIHIVHKGLEQFVTASSESLPHGESELDKLKLKTVAMAGYRLPRLEGPKIAFFCEKYEIHEVGNTPQSLILGLVKRLYIDDEVADTKGGRLKVYAGRVDPLSRLGGNDYGTLGDMLTVVRPK